MKKPKEDKTIKALPSGGKRVGCPRTLGKDPVKTNSRQMDINGEQLQRSPRIGSDSSSGGAMLNTKRQELHEAK